MAKRSPYPKLAPVPTDKVPAYEVGYGRPPRHTQFRPGQSGNPIGRPAGARNRMNRIPALNDERMKTVVQMEAYRLIGVRDGDRLVEVPVIQAIIRSVALNAAKGHQGSQRMFTELLHWVERENKALHDEWLNTAIDYKTGWEKELERRRKLGVDEPDPIPHPDDIVINMNTGRVEIKGPMTKEEKVTWDRAREHMAEHDEFVGELEAMIRKRPKDKELPRILANQRKINARLAKVVGAYAARMDEEERRRKAEPAAPASDLRVVSFEQTRK